MDLANVFNSKISNCQEVEIGQINQIVVFKKDLNLFIQMTASVEINYRQLNFLYNGSKDMLKFSSKLVLVKPKYLSPKNQQSLIILKWSLISNTQPNS